MLKPETFEAAALPFAVKVAVTSSVIVAMVSVYTVLDTLYDIVSPTLSSLKNLEPEPINEVESVAIVILPVNAVGSNNIESLSSCAM